MLACYKQSVVDTTGHFVLWFLFILALRSLRGKAISTLSKEEIVTEMTTLGIDVVELCKIGGLQEETEVLCRILHYALNINEQVHEPVAGPSLESDEPAKKRIRTKTNMVRESNDNNNNNNNNNNDDNNKLRYIKLEII